MTTSHVTPFVSGKEIKSSEALSHFVSWAKSQCHALDKPSEPFSWEAISWFRWGLKNSNFKKLRHKSNKPNQSLVDYAKAYVFQERVIFKKNQVNTIITLRCLDTALIEVGGSISLPQINGAIFDRTARLILENYNGSTVLGCMNKLKAIHKHLMEIGVVAEQYQWEHCYKPNRRSLIEDESHSLSKLPSKESLLALGEIFHSDPTLKVDIVTTSAAAILLSQPSRVSELTYLKKDCLLIEKDRSGREQLYLVWHSLKGFGPTRKLVPDSMAEICKLAIKRVSEISEESRKYAKWLEENPDLFPIHSKTPAKEQDAELSYKEACDALLISTETNSPRSAFRLFLNTVLKGKSCSNVTRNICIEYLEGYNDSTRTKVRSPVSNSEKFTYQDTCRITLRTLNVLVRDRYLNNNFPYTDDKKITKWKDALFCFHSGSLVTTKTIAAQKPLGLVGCTSMKLASQLSRSTPKMPSIFDRYGYFGVRVNSHAFRHFLNTAAQKSNVSQEIIARWSGRTDLSQNKVYNHVTIEDRRYDLEVLDVSTLSKAESLLSKIRRKTAISISDIGLSGDRLAHRTEFGICLHDYAQEPCSKFNNCLNCNEHICVKGDETKLENLKSERIYLLGLLKKFREETDKKAYGLNNWLKNTVEKLNKCNSLISILEDPDVQEGAVIKNTTDGWSSTTNALNLNESIEKSSDSNTSLLIDNNIREIEKLIGSDNDA
ncbi:hypothetical protein ABMA57_02015 [Saccharospirillum sp. HFRX-1]|uniref:hypothetical protein n=1 Tax=unclassified Saccharospirillum TaxID=2633430 RepID=UPI00370FCAEA